MSAIDRPTASAIGNELDRLFARGRVLCDGAMGTMLFDCGISMDRCYEELNLSQPETIASIHNRYIDAGAGIIETHTFGGNALRLERNGLLGKVREINLAGARIARQCAAQITEKQTNEIYVAGAVGPLGVRLAPGGRIGLKEARAAFFEQIHALCEGGPRVGVDLLMIETMTSLAEACEAVHAAHEVEPELRIVVMMTVDADGNCLDGTSTEAAAVRLTELGASAVGCNCSGGPASVLRAVERMRTATHLPLAAMPNAGLPRAVDGRTKYLVPPEDMANFAREAIQAGASLVGGCCGTTPDHTRAMKSALRAIEAEHLPGFSNDSAQL